jgi:hypothetical protein
MLKEIGNHWYRFSENTVFKSNKLETLGGGNKIESKGDKNVGSNQSLYQVLCEA